MVLPVVGHIIPSEDVSVRRAWDRDGRDVFVEGCHGRRCYATRLLAPLARLWVSYTHSYAAASHARRNNGRRQWSGSTVPRNSEIYINYPVTNKRFERGGLQSHGETPNTARSGPKEPKVVLEVLRLNRGNRSTWNAMIALLDQVKFPTSSDEHVTLAYELRSGECPSILGQGIDGSSGTRRSARIRVYPFLILPGFLVPSTAGKILGITTISYQF